MSEYLPRVESQLVVWYINFAAKLATHGALVGVSAGEITLAGTYSTMLQRVVNGRQVKKTDAEEWTAYKDLIIYGSHTAPEPTEPTSGTITPAAPDPIPVGVIEWTRMLVERIKNHTGFTAAIGEDLGIISPPAGAVPTEPTISAAAETDFAVRISFAMEGFPMLEIQSKRGSESDFSVLAFDTSSPYVDTRAPLVAGTPEVRQYRARFIQDDAPVGGWSLTVSATAGP
jgi:hypothetical protein